MSSPASPRGLQQCLRVFWPQQCLEVSGWSMLQLCLRVLRACEIFAHEISLSSLQLIAAQIMIRVQRLSKTDE